MQSASIRMNLKGMSSGVLSRFEKFTPFVFKAFFVLKLWPRGSLCGALPNSGFSSRLSGFTLETCGDQKSVCGQRRQDVLALLSLHSHCVFTSNYGSSHREK